MAGKLGLARLETLLENLDRELDLNDSNVIYKEKVQNINAAKNLTAADCGTIILGVVGTQQAVGTGFNLNLPAPERGLHYKFILAAPSIAANANAAITITSTSNGSSAANLGIGSVTVNGATTNVTSVADIVTFVHDAATCGDFAEVSCDGTNWIWNIYGDGTGSVTLA